MESSFISSGGRSRRGGPTRCFYGEKLAVVVSWIADNHSRRFYGSLNDWVGHKCRYFDWRDDELCWCDKVLILE
ncbi:hypothetical protein CMV_017778 [Castanea mollissima]|uniref:Uncharacterized protein n=1 Tax=Castanea mollissima TaxID=60419 RepID=A0A8J4R2D9_9ROSI|nr:hypothetical protein CMV_017778 [Castanea mollissima]